MNLTKKQKEIVKKIASGEVTDILSYMKAFNLGECKALNKEEIELRCNEKYKNHHFVVKNKECVRDANIIKSDEYTQANIYVRDVSESSYRYECRGSSMFFTIYEPRYIANDFSDIISFISLWQYMKSRGLIIELSRIIEKDDFSLCTDIVSPYHYEYGEIGKENRMSSNNGRIDNLEDWAEIETYEQGRDYEEFLEWNFEFSKEKMTIIYDYISLKIYPAPELQNYIQNGFVTEQEKKEGLNIRIAFAGVVIAILTSLLSIIGNNSSSELQKLQIELEGIKQEMIIFNEK